MDRTREETEELCGQAYKYYKSAAKYLSKCAKLEDYWEDTLQYGILAFFRWLPGYDPSICDNILLAAKIRVVGEMKTYLIRVLKKEDGISQLFNNEEDDSAPSQDVLKVLAIDPPDVLRKFKYCLSPNWAIDLKPKERYVIREVFFKERNYVDIMRDPQISLSHAISVTRILQRALKKIRWQEGIASDVYVGIKTRNRVGIYADKNRQYYLKAKKKRLAVSA